MWKILAPLALCATVLTACGDQPSGASAGSASPASAPSSATTPPSVPPSPTSGPPEATPWPPGRGPIPLDLPLDQDLEWYPADGGKRLGPSPVAPGIAGVVACGSPVWPPSDLSGTTGRLAVTGTGPEHGDVRELVTFADEGQARAALDRLRAVVEACPSEEVEGGGGVTWHVLEPGAGPASATYASSITPGIGGTAVQATVVGRAVLLVQALGEFGPDSHAHVGRELSARTHALAPMLCFATETRCGAVEPPTIGPEGVGVDGVRKVVLGMSATAVESLGATLENGHGVDCTAFSLRLPTGEVVTGTVAPRIGVSQMSVEHGRTPEGAGPRTTYDDLRAIYAGEISTTGQQGPVVVIPHSDRQYEFSMEADRVAEVVLAFGTDPC